MLTTRQRYTPPIIIKQSSGGPKVIAMISKVASNWFQSPSTIVSKFSQSCLKIGSKLSQSFLGAVWRLFQSFFEVVWKLCQYFLKAVSRLSNRIIKQKKKGIKSFRKTATKTALKKKTIRIEGPCRPQDTLCIPKWHRCATEFWNCFILNWQNCIPGNRKQKPRLLNDLGIDEKWRVVLTKIEWRQMWKEFITSANLWSGLPTVEGSSRNPHSNQKGILVSLFFHILGDLRCPTSFFEAILIGIV